MQYLEAYPAVAILCTCCPFCYVIRRSPTGFSTDGQTMQTSPAACVVPAGYYLKVSTGLLVQLLLGLRHMFAVTLS